MVARLSLLERDTLVEIGAANPPESAPPWLTDYAPPPGRDPLFSDAESAPPPVDPNAPFFNSPFLAPPPEAGGPVNEPPGNPVPLGPETSMAVGAMAGIAVGAAATGLIACFVVWWIRRSLKADSSDDELFLENLPGVPSRFCYDELERATNHFDDCKRLGGGAFGSVYEGALPNGVKIAVKKLNRQIGSQDFRAEVATVGGTCHINLVRLLGFCAQGPHRLLVYEFMPNSSLDKWIFKASSAGGNEDTTTLDWSRRFNIALGTARGLAYLHNECNKRIIHFDIKPQNILLDAHFVPKVADFGLSRIFERNHADSGLEVAVTTMRGTPGYFAPEIFLQGMTITEKGDVYSYGLVLFELVGGKKNSDPSNPKGDTYFPATCLREVTENGFVGRTLSELVDPRLGGCFDEEQAKRVLHVAFCCIQKHPETRPDMREVVLMLEGNLQLLDHESLPSMRFSGEVQRSEARSEVIEREIVQRQATASDYSVTAEFDPTPSTAFVSEEAVPMAIQ